MFYNYVKILNLMTLEVIAPIYEAALSMKPDYDVEKIYELLEKNKKLA